MVSFVYVAIYWINHHNLLSYARRVTARLTWANNAVLFCMSLIPFATAYVADTDVAPFPAMVYGAVQFASGIAFNLVVFAVTATRHGDEAFLEGARTRRSPFAAVRIFINVALAYLDPGLLAELPQRGR